MSKRHPAVVISLYPDEAAAIRAVSFGQADAAQVNLAVASYVIQQHHSVVVRHGGAIEVRSAPGKGATFEVLLPAAPGVASEAKDAIARTPQRRGRVLLMDDDQVVRRTASRILEGLGCEVAVAADGLEALASWEQGRREGRPFDAVVVDLTVRGGMGGVETLRKLLALDPAVRVVVSSGYSEAAEMADSAAHGFAAVLPKPYSAADLRAVLGPLLPLA